MPRGRRQGDDEEFGKPTRARSALVENANFAIGHGDVVIAPCLLHNTSNRR